MKVAQKPHKLVQQESDKKQVQQNQKKEKVILNSYRRQIEWDFVV